jgi:hypothetical protein
MKSTKFKPLTDSEIFRRAVEMQAIGNTAAHNAQEKNRRLGIPNYYSVNGQIFSDALDNSSAKSDSA